jgi:hypothetical protein
VKTGVIPNGKSLDEVAANDAEKKAVMELGDTVVVVRAVPAGADAHAAGQAPVSPGRMEVSRRRSVNRVAARLRSLTTRPRSDRSESSSAAERHPFDRLREVVIEAGIIGIRRSTSSANNP